MRLLFVFYLISLLGMNNQAALDVELTTTAKRKGVIRLAVFDSASALKAEKPVSGQVLPLTKTAAPLERLLTNLPEGKFAIAAYHDLNNNGKLDRNAFGIPSEPYAFSGQPASKWRAPKWEEVAIDNNQNKAKLQLRLKYWKEQ